MNIESLGWNKFFDESFSELNVRDFIPARVSQEHRNLYRILCDQGEVLAEISGKYRYQAIDKADFPTVGDWVAVEFAGDDKAIIHNLILRRNKFSRKVPGTNTIEQVLVANIDKLFIVCGLDGDFNPRRIERYLTIAWDNEMKPVVVLNKTDLCQDPESSIAEAEAVAFGIPVIPVSAKIGDGIDLLREHIGQNETISLLGSSGVGKSSIINALLGKEQLKIGDVREFDKKGKHTTTHREMILLPEGGIIIDTPGMRELQLWGDEDGLEQTFEDIEELATSCRFNDCGHNGEPGCAIENAIADGSLDPKRFRSYQKLQKELRHLERRQDQKASQLEKKKWKKITQWARRMDNPKN